MSHVESVRTPRRAFWGDARFLLGILLIVASVAGVWLVVAAARQTAPAYAATRTLVPGQAITADDLRQVEVALGQVGEAYLAPGDGNDDLVATRTIEAGELVPAEAVGDADDARTTNVVVQSSVEVPASVDAGTGVEVWAAPLLETGEYDEPRILIADATVVSVTRDDSMMGGGAASLELVIPRADVAAALAALAHEAAISVIPAAGGGA